MNETFLLYTGEHNGSLATVMILEEEFINESQEPADYFLPGTTNITAHGKLDVSGEAVDVLAPVMRGD